MQLASKIGRYVKEYVEKVKPIEYVREVRVIENEGGYPRIWTIIEAPPFEDSLLNPIFEAEGEILRTGNIPVDFELLNLSEYPDKTALSGVIPPEARSVCRR